MTIPEFSTITWIISASLFGGLLSVLGAGVVALNTRATWVPLLISYAIGAMLGAVFLEILPEAFRVASSIESMTTTILLGILLFFVLEKLVIWRHCHGDHCEVHAIHTEEDCPANIEAKANLSPNVASENGFIKFKKVDFPVPFLPIIPIRSPLWKSKLKLSRITWSLNFLETLWNSIILLPIRSMLISSSTAFSRRRLWAFSFIT